MSNMNIGVSSAAMQPVAARVIEVVAMVLGDAEQAITTESRIEDDLQFDSLDNTELLIELEDEFEIRITDDTAAGWKTVQDIINTVMNLTASGAQQ